MLSVIFHWSIHTATDSMFSSCCTELSGYQSLRTVLKYDWCRKVISPTFVSGDDCHIIIKWVVLPKVQGFDRRYGPVLEYNVCRTSQSSLTITMTRSPHPLFNTNIAHMSSFLSPVLSRHYGMELTAVVGLYLDQLGGHHHKREARAKHSMNIL